jgi:hypothetical protein
MNQEPKSIWKKSWTGWRSRWVWLAVLTVATFVVLFCLGLATSPETSMGKLVAFALLFATGLMLTAGLLVAFIRWICCWKNFRRFLFALACFITLIALFYAEEDWRGKHDWEKFKQHWEAKGEKFDFKDFIPPPVPDDQNFAMAPIWVKLIEANVGTNIAQTFYGTNRVAAAPIRDADRLQLDIGDERDYRHWPAVGYWAKATLTDLKLWQNYYRSLAAQTDLFPVAPSPQTPAQDVLLALSKYNPTIEALRQASRRPYARFPLNYNAQPPAYILLAHLAVLRRCTQVLELRAFAELQNNESNQALADVNLMLRLTDSIRDEPFLVSQLVRIAMLQGTVQPIYEGLAEHRWSDAQLAELDTELANLNFLADFERSMRGERAYQLAVAEFPREGQFRELRQLSLFDWGSNPKGEVARVLFFEMCPAGWIYQNELRLCRFYQKWYLPLADVKEMTVSPAAVGAAQNALVPEFRRRTPENFPERMLLPAFALAVEKFAYAQSSVDLARVAIALERYRLAHGEYPATLDALAPQFIEKLPHDVIGGGPLHFRRTDDGQFVLYSVGWNERDDGGVVGLLKRGGVDLNKGDWVWRYPSN